ncbi:epoxide hydrolase family protein [Cellulomonas alba]|uniref:Epoxide hydrolase n=1 Tax=Cellulomonas alba TaxID=3053467 RepID=A0ABT7SDU0_9CELL|nr:epoxide hydrolase family protein [Cellulomonas alba]MDM7854224.1 epoxide hydrolase [Cellulomonas alba]
MAARWTDDVAAPPSVAVAPELSPPAGGVLPVVAHLPGTLLEELRDRLRRTRWPREVPGTGWTRGTPVAALRPLVERWATTYSWRAVERRLDAVPQVVTLVDGQRVHALHARSHEPDALPLLLTHGWPGSTLDVLDLLGPLTDPVAHGGRASDAFHVVAPSLPGAGFSAPLAGPGWDHVRIARAWVVVMARLGYERFGAAGGDTGSVVSPLVGRVAPDRVVGVHVHASLDLPALTDQDERALTGSERDRVAWGRSRAAVDGGYAAVHATRPHTIGAALADSPVGQLAWVLDKVHDWTDPAHPDPLGGVDPDALLDLATLVWATGTAATSANLYLENRVAPAVALPRSDVPTGVALFPTDPSVRLVVSREHRITRWTELDRGGHFAAWEAPDLLVDELRAFFRSVR